MEKNPYEPPRLPSERPAGRPWPFALADWTLIACLAVVLVVIMFLEMMPANAVRE